MREQEMDKARRYDVAIIGSGFGGASMAWSLTRAGLKTTLIERGGWAARDHADWDALKILIEKRYGSDSPVMVSQYGGAAEEDRQNEAVGGLSVFYGGAVFRLRETDFRHWPFDYSELEKWYAMAEELYEVHGEVGVDPLEPPRSTGYPVGLPGMTRPARRIMKAAERLGYHPFAIPMAINYEENDRSKCESCFTCDGFPCRIGAKNDTAVTALRKADQANLHVMAGTIAARLNEENGRVVSVECIDKKSGERSTVVADTFVVSCGAVHSPAVLLRSGIERFDRSGCLGRNLMRHCNAIVGSLFPFRVNPDGVNHKQVAILDFYEDMREETGAAVGVIQDMCMPPAPAVRHLAPKGFRYLASAFSTCIQSLLCIAEDAPRLQNRVTLGSGRDDFGLPITEIAHEYSAEDLMRRDFMVKVAKMILRKAGGLVPKVREIGSFSHAVGSVRFGDDPKIAVLDPYCRVFGTENLHVVDGSFMPTSGGVNPSLTIAANALRVAAEIGGRGVSLQSTVDSSQSGEGESP